MNNLVEFIERTKGIEYLIAIGFLIGCIAFWMFLHRQSTDSWVKILAVVALALAFGILAIMAIGSQDVQERLTTAAAAVEPPLLSSHVLAVMYGPASFDHESHQNLVKDCAFCHHYSQGRVPGCSECHGQAFNPVDLNKPGLAHVYHLRCISCHMENQAGPVDCVECHTKAEVPPLSAAHPLTGVTNCLSCHGEKGIPGVSRVPADHLGVTNGVCQLCHQPRIEAKDLAKLTHGIGGREGCLMCHGGGIGWAAKVPENHAGRTNETCTLCHKSL